MTSARRGGRERPPLPSTPDLPEDAIGDAPEPAPRHAAVVPVAAVIALAASGIFVVQFLTDAPPLGIAGLAALFAPAILLALAASPSLRRTPATVLLVLAGTLSLLILLGIAAAMTPRGLDARTTAGLGQLVLTLTFGIWLARSRRAGSALPAPRDRLLAGMAIPLSAARPGIRSTALVLAGVVMAGAGVLVANGAAQGQAHAGYVVLAAGRAPGASGAPAGAGEPGASGAPAAAGVPVVTVANASGGPLACSLDLARPGADPVSWSNASIGNDQTWQETLPIAAAGQQATWLLRLRCIAPDGGTIERQLRIEPPA